jgi:hypothetical protein
VITYGRFGVFTEVPFGLRGAIMFVPRIDDGMPMRQTALAEIDRVVSERLGRARVAGNAQPAAFNTDSRYASMPRPVVPCLSVGARR